MRNPGSFLKPSYVLESVSSELYESCMGMYKPITQGRIVLDKIRKTRYTMWINELIGLDLKTKTKVLDLLSDEVIEPLKVSEIRYRLREVEKKSLEITELRDAINKLDNVFKKLNKKEKKEMLGYAVFYTMERIEYIRNYINKVLWNEDVDNVKEFIIMDQVFLTILDLLSYIEFSSLEEVAKKGYVAEVLWLLLRLWAYKRGKISIHNLEEDISIISLPPTPRYVEEGEYPAVMEVLGR